MARLVFNQDALNYNGFNTLDGSKHRGHPRLWKRVADRDAAAPVACNRSIVHACLLEAVGGCRNSYLLFLRLIDGRVSVRQAADLTGIPRMTLWRTVKRALQTTRRLLRERMRRAS